MTNIVTGIAVYVCVVAIPTLTGYWLSWKALDNYELKHRRKQ